MPFVHAWCLYISGHTFTYVRASHLSNAVHVGIGARNVIDVIIAVDTRKQFVRMLQAIAASGGSNELDRQNTVQQTSHAVTYYVCYMS